MSSLRISTMTGLSELSSNIDLDVVFNNLSINDNIRYIEYGNNTDGSKRYKGYSKKNLKKVRKVNKRNIFFNQATIHIYLNKVINMKVFNNGKIQMTVLIDEQQIHNVLYLFIKECNTLSEKVLIDNDNPKIIYSDIVLINSDFDIGFPINREILYRYLIRDGYFCTYEPCQYPGINIKYYNNVLNNNGICNCTEVCDGKGNSNGNGECKRITLAIFKSGKIIITGGKELDQVYNAYRFITDYLIRYKQIILNK